MKASLTGLFHSDTLPVVGRRKVVSDESSGGDVNVFSRFILNGLTHANRLLGAKVFNEAEWRVVGEYVFDEEGGRHQAFYSPLREMTVLGTVVRPHERIQVEQSVKYSQKDAERLWSASGLQAVQRWTTRGDEYGK